MKVTMIFIVIGTLRMIPKGLKSDPLRIVKKKKGDKWYTPKPESILENGTYKILNDFEIQTAHQIQTRRQNLEFK